MIFRQLFEPVSSTYTYLLGCEETGQAVLIDSVIIAVERDLEAVARLGLRLAYSLDTHVHADHISGALRLKQEAGSKVAMPKSEHLACADVEVEEGHAFSVGQLSLQPLHTPGHTAGHYSYLCKEKLFTGDALLIDGCGRTDFQGGDAATLYRSVHDKLFSLPDETLVYPGHDYQGRRVSCIGQEKQRNPRLGGNRSIEEFIGIMANLKLAYPRFIDYAVPGNRACGVCPTALPHELEQYCPHMSETPQG